MDDDVYLISWTNMDVFPGTLPVAIYKSKKSASLSCRRLNQVEKKEGPLHGKSFSYKLYKLEE